MNAENMYDAWDNGDRHEIRQQFARREEIIRMAREAGLLNCDCCLPFWEEDDQENWKRFFVNFATLIAAAEREKVARWQIGSGYTTGHGDTIEDLLTELEWQVRESEREAIAQMIEDAPTLVESNKHGGCLMCGFTPKLAAAAIRARGETK